MSKSLAVSKSKVKLFSEFAPKGASLPKEYRAAVGVDEKNRPAWFLFDKYAFWEFLCRIDENLLFDNMPEEEYESNPIGKLVDKLETDWPFDEKSRREFKTEYEKALEDIAAGKVFSL